jgi:hypothetical protein
MANTNFELVGLDFASIKSNLKSYLKNNTQFKDLDYEGSNINVLLDVMAYNTYLNAFYTNMVASEMFLDSAQLRDSIVSHAKELNYTPRSFTSAKAGLSVTITPNTAVSSVVVPKYTSFTSRVGSNTYSFSTGEAFVVTSDATGKFMLSTDVYEGTVTTDTFVMNGQSKQRFVLSSPTVDVLSLDVSVYEDSGQTLLTYTRATKLLGVTDTSKVFFVQAAENQQYEIVFGDGVFGRRPKAGSTVVVRYRSCAGELPNGASVFVPDGLIDGHANIAVTTTSVAVGGAVAETLESIKFNAPRAFQAQDRAVTASDYETLLSANFSDIQAISVYGGEDVDPPRYGRVIISVDVAGAEGAPLSRKQTFYDFIKDRSPLTIQPEFIDPDFLYVHVSTDVNYNINTTTKTTTDIASAVRAAISSYNTTNLNKFKTTLYYSAMCAQIDNADASIIGNDTTVTIAKRIYPTVGVKFQSVVDTHNPLSVESSLEMSGGSVHYGHTLTSTYITYQGNQAIIIDDAQGNILAATISGSSVIATQNIGTINYETGRLSFTNVIFDSYEGSYIELYLIPRAKNITAKQNTILVVNDEDVTVNVTGVRQ